MEKEVTTCMICTAPIPSLYVLLKGCAFNSQKPLNTRATLSIAKGRAMGGGERQVPGDTINAAHVSFSMQDLPALKTCISDEKWAEWPPGTWQWE